MQRTYFNSVVVDGHKTLRSFGLNIFHGLTLNFDSNNPPMRQMVILIVLAEGRLTKVSSLLGSLDGWVVELGLDRDHMKLKECLPLPSPSLGNSSTRTWRCYKIPLGHGVWVLPLE